MSDELRGSPFLNHVICGSGSPFTVHLRQRGSPSLTASALGSSPENPGGPIRASSGGTGREREMGCLREGKYREEFRLDWSTYATENIAILPSLANP